MNKRRLWGSVQLALNDRMWVHSTSGLVEVAGRAQPAGRPWIEPKRLAPWKLLCMIGASVRGPMMHDTELARIAADPRYIELASRRRRFTWALTGVMLTVYLGFILLIAFDKALLAQPLGDGVTSVGIVVGFGIIMLAIVLTGIYVRRAANEFDPLTKALRSEPRA